MRRILTKNYIFFNYADIEVERIGEQMNDVEWYSLLIICLIRMSSRKMKSNVESKTMRGIFDICIKIQTNVFKFVEVESVMCFLKEYDVGRRKEEKWRNVESGSGKGSNILESLKDLCKIIEIVQWKHWNKITKYKNF